MTKPAIKLGSQMLLSVYLHPDDYVALRSYSEMTYGPKKMAGVVREALREYFEKREVPFKGIDPREIKFEES